MTVFNHKESDELYSEIKSLLKCHKDLDKEIKLGLKTEKRKKEIYKELLNNRNIISRITKRKQELYDMNTRRIRKAQFSIVAGLLLSDIFNFILFFLTRNRSDLLFGFFLLNILTIIFTVWHAYRFVLNKNSARWLPIFGIVNSLSLFIVTFSSLYWLQGTAANWNMALSHIDAVFVTTGILTTAGTGNILPISELARGIELLQMVLAFILFSPLIVLIINRFWEDHNLNVPKLESSNQSRN